VVESAEVVSRVVRDFYKVFGIMALLLYVGMAVLLFRGPTFTTSDVVDEAVSVSCGSLIAVGWPSDHSYLADEGSTSWSDHIDHIESGEGVGTPGRLGIARDCSERRDTYMALIVIAGVFANLLTMVAILGRRDDAAARAYQAARNKPED